MNNYPVTGEAGTAKEGSEIGEEGRRGKGRGGGREGGGKRIGAVR